MSIIEDLKHYISSREHSSQCKAVSLCLRAAKELQTLQSRVVESKKQIDKLNKAIQELNAIACLAPITTPNAKTLADRLRAQANHVSVEWEYGEETVGLMLEAAETLSSG